MKATLSRVWESRSPRDRRIIAISIAVFILILYLMLVQSAGKAQTSLQKSVMDLHTQETFLNDQAIEYNRLRNMSVITTSPTDLHTLVQIRILDAGLSNDLLRINAIDANQVVVVFGAIAFSDWLHWIIDLKSQHIRVAKCRIEALSTSGQVSVTATLVRPN